MKLEFSDLERRYMQNDRVLVLRLRDEIGNDHRVHGDLFKYKSYQRWAIDEILSRFYKTNMPMKDVVEDFAMQMDDYACEAPETTKMIFSAAYDTAMYVLDYLL